MYEEQDSKIRTCPPENRSGMQMQLPEPEGKFDGR